MTEALRVTLTDLPDFDTTNVSDDDLLALRDACTLELERRAAVELA